MKIVPTLVACAACRKDAGAVRPASGVGIEKAGVVPGRARVVPSVSVTVTVAPRGRLIQQRG